MQTQAVDIHQPPHITDIRKDAKPLKGAMCRVEIDCLPAQQLVPGAYLVQHGTNQINVFRSDLPVIMAMKEDEPELVEQAQKAYEKKFAKYMAERLKGVSDPDQIARLSIRFRAEFPGSMPGIFNDLNGRDIKPFKSVRVIEDSVQNPFEAEQAEVQAAQGRALGAAIRDGIREERAQQSSNQQKR